MRSAVHNNTDDNGSVKPKGIYVIEIITDQGMLLIANVSSG